MKASGGVMSAVQAGRAVTIAAFEIGRERVVVKGCPHDSAAIVLSAAILGGGGTAIVATRRPDCIDIR